MSAQELKRLNDEILAEVRNTYTNFSKERERITQRYGSSVAAREKLTELRNAFEAKTREKLQRFNENYQQSVTELSKKLDAELTPAHDETPAFYAKMQLWLNMFNGLDPEQMSLKYRDAVLKGDNEMLYFVEKVYFPSVEHDTGKARFLKPEIDRQQAERLPADMREEKATMQQLNRAFINGQSLARQWSFDNLRSFFFATGAATDFDRGISTMFKQPGE